MVPDALEAFAILLGSTIWFEIKGAGYLGAYFDGFNDLLVRIAEDMQRLVPRVIGPHQLKTMWGYKYEQGMVGINPHAICAERQFLGHPGRGQPGHPGG